MQTNTKLGPTKLSTNRENPVDRPCQALVQTCQHVMWSCMQTNTKLGPTKLFTNRENPVDRPCQAWWCNHVNM